MTYTTYDALATARELSTVNPQTHVRATASLSRRIFEDLVTGLFVLHSGKKAWMPARILYFSQRYQDRKYLDCITKYPDFSFSEKVAHLMHTQVEQDPDNARKRLFQEYEQERPDAFRKWGVKPVHLSGDYDSSLFDDRHGFRNEESSWCGQLNNVKTMCEKLDGNGQRISLSSWKFDEAYSFFYKGLSEFVHGGSMSSYDTFVPEVERAKLRPEITLEIPYPLLAYTGSLFFAGFVKRIMRFRVKQVTARLDKAFDRLTQIAQELAMVPQT
jgi:hypothetical protein